MKKFSISAGLLFITLSGCNSSPPAQSVDTTLPDTNSDSVKSQTAVLPSVQAQIPATDPNCSEQRRVTDSEYVGENGVHYRVDSNGSCTPLADEPATQARVDDAPTESAPSEASTTNEQAGPT